MAKATDGDLKYYILLMITDGEITGKLFFYSFIFIIFFLKKK